MIAVQAQNYTSFRTTLILYPLIFMPTAWIMLEKLGESRLNGYTGEPLANN